MKKKKIKTRNPYAFALLSKIFQQKIVKNKKKYNRKNQSSIIKQAVTENYEQPVFLLA